MSSIRTDLAYEAMELYRAEVGEEMAGAVVTESERDGFSITRVRITDAEGEKNIGKPMGNYITIEIPAPTFREFTDFQDVSKLLADELRALAPISSDAPVLIAGLGNWNITPDSIGPKVVSKVLVTRHLFEHLPEVLTDSMRSACAISPGVLGITGMETGEIIRGVVEKVKPCLVIVVDALASRSVTRISRTVQIADTGIVPGSGVGNNRRELSKKTLGVPVIAIGVPMVIDAGTVASDAMDMLAEALQREGAFGELVHDVQFQQKHTMISELLEENDSLLVVTPTDVDVLSDKISTIIADGINLAVHDGLSLEEMEQYMM